MWRNFPVEGAQGAWFVSQGRTTSRRLSGVCCCQAASIWASGTGSVSMRSVPLAASAMSWGVEDDVDAAGGSSAGNRFNELLIRLVEADRHVSTKRRQFIEHLCVAPKDDDFSCAQAFGDLHRQLASSSRGPNNQDGFPFCQLRPCERKPGGHARVEQGGSGQIIETVRDREDHLTKNDAALCHRSVGWSSLVEVDPRAIVERAHSVSAGDLREDVGAPRLRTARLCSDKRMQPGGANVHAHFPLARRWLREVFKARRLLPRMTYNIFHYG